MNPTIETFRILYGAGEVARCHTQRVIHRQTVADHSWGVCLIITWLFGGDPPSRLIVAGLIHDAPEKLTGDVPATTKWRNVSLDLALEKIEYQFYVDHGLNFLDEEDLNILSFADSIELVLYCIAEANMGNSRVEEMGSNACAAAKNKLELMPIGSLLRTRGEQLLDLVGG